MTTPAIGTLPPAAAMPGTAAVQGPTQNTASAPGASGSLLDPQAFLQLLVAQLKYQDPTNPVDTSTFMNQTAMLSQVQTMGTMSTTLTSLVATQQAQTATGLIGKQIDYTDSSGSIASGAVTSASLNPAGATVSIGTITVPLASVQRVTVASAAPIASTATSTT